MLRWLRNRFLTGVVVAAPIGITFWLIYSFVTFVDQVIKPLVPARYNPESYLPFAIPGMGLLIAVLGLTLLGALAANIFGRSLLDLGERVLNSVPLIRNIYAALKQIVETVFQGQQNSFKEVVLVEYPMAGSYAVAFVASTGRGVIRSVVGKGDDVIGVFIPTTPNPTSGFLLFVPRSKAIALDLTVEEAAKLIISFGMVTPDRLPDGAIPQAEPGKAGAGLMPDDAQGGDAPESADPDSPKP
ncbi:DUF502 domain-containing protein [Oceanicaulis alexandrii]|uniref:DUF502 domain-containing protein n=1 Tax=Oceanicaulis alexandrii TaxID=153233 RepID=UPI00235330C7|nr:DUF502 domain-containing protein [Oceanicaulis alexandrii]